MATKPFENAGDGGSPPASVPRVISLQIVPPEPADDARPDELLEDLRRRASLKRSPEPGSLSVAINEAGGGAERVQMMVIRERLNGLEGRSAESQAILRRLERMLEQIQLLLYAAVGVAAVGLILAFIALVV